MDKGTPKSYRSTAEKSKITQPTPAFFDQDFQVEKQYLQKLRTQRIKAEKLYHQYTLINKDREKLRTEKLKLQEELDSLNKKHKSKIEESLQEINKLTATIHQLQKQNEKLRMERQETLQLRLSFESKTRELHNRLTHYQQTKFGSDDIIQHLEAQVQHLQSQNRKVYEQKQLQVSNLQQKCQQIQRNYQKHLKQSQREKELFERQRKEWLQQKIKCQQLLMQKSNYFNSCKQKLQSELKDKNKRHEILASDFQENKKFWTIKLEEKNKQINNLRKSLETAKEQCKKLRRGTDDYITILRQKQIQEYDLQHSLAEATKRYLKAETQLKEKDQKQKRTEETLKSLELKVAEKEGQLKENKRNLLMMGENCGEYLRIIKMKEEMEEERMGLFETEFQEIQKMEKVFSKFQ